jgi:hypothetical protein
MPTLSSITIEAAPSAAAKLYLPVERHGEKLKAQGVSLVHTYQTDVKVFSECDYVWLQVALVAWQIHPATIEELDALGPIGGANMRRWTLEGPLMHRPGDPGAASNCSMRIRLAHSFRADPGTDWRPYEAGKYRCRSARAELTITRPSTDYDFRVARFTLEARRISAPQRARKVHAGVIDTVPAGMSRVVSTDFEVEATGSLEIEAGGILEIT